MRNMTARCLLSAFGATVLIATGTAAMAQSDPAAATYWGGVSTGMGSGCPATEWHLRPMQPTGPATISGVAYFSDMSGISKIRGTRTADGTITGSVTSVSGHGPSGLFSGTRTATDTQVTLAGTGCSQHAVNIHRMPAGYGTISNPG
jgi:hypothetical protein